ncbi:MAG: DNA gyrase C-terminal beta-propeller domain-containing protein, partial [Pseudomonadota bacterium]
PHHSHVLTVTANGYGKLTKAEDYPEKGRGTMGVISIQTTTRNGNVVCAVPTTLDDEIMIATADGQMIRMRIADISIMSRNTQGVRLFSIEGTKVKLVTALPASMLNGGAEEEAEEVPTTPELAIEGETPTAEA